MVTVDGNWIPEGIDIDNPERVKTSREMMDVINDIGFLPLFKNNIKGFSVEEMTASSAWWCGNPDEDPWMWREIIAAEGSIAYGKFFCGRAGFISREWFPTFASYRRDGYDFDSRYEDGLASYKAKRVMDLLMQREALLSNEIRAFCGFCKGGETGFEGVITTLQMQTYITVKAFIKRSNKRNEEYGWPVALYTTAENLFGTDYVRSGYHIGTLNARGKIAARVAQMFPEAKEQDIIKLIK